ncbi:DUF397 domain-containing protein [Streptomyces sp. 4F14]|uniref:DUF397 domain-containing protein n=1 Tax=Streptomyces sp. 4F14 TaxID=3394380 RepID=UPI003A899D11
MAALAQRSREPGWRQRAGLARPTYTEFIDYEKTPDYARAILSAAPSTLSPEDVDALVEARTKRQEILRRPTPPCLCVIQSEAALQLEVGGREAMRKQLEHLETMAGHPSVEVQVIPDRAGAHAGLAGHTLIFDSLRSIALSPRDSLEVITRVRQEMRQQVERQWTSTPGPETAVWRKSSYSGQGGDCLEVTDNLPGTLLVRDSKTPDRTPLPFTPTTWTAFIRTL